jgi:hypothetical protein
MGSARWYFVFDAANRAYKISKGAADQLLSADFTIPDGIPLRDEHGVVLAEVVVRTNNRRAECVEQIGLFALPAREGSAGKRAALSRGLSAGLRMELRRRLGRRQGADLGLTLDEAAFSALDQRITAGETGGEVYRVQFDRLRDAVERISRRSR